MNDDIVIVIGRKRFFAVKTNFSWIWRSELLFPGTRSNFSVVNFPSSYNPNISNTDD